MAGVRPEGANSSRAEDRATGFCPDLSAMAVNARLKQSLEALRQAEKSAVLWFAEVMQRKLYRDLGYSSIHQYAELELGFKKARISQFIRLSEAFRELPKLMESVARGDVSWTKAREVSGVATQETESAWIAEAQKSTSRELEQKVAITRQRAKAVRSGAAAQGELEATEATETVVPRVFEPPADVPADLHYRLSPIQLTRYEALVEKLRKLGAEGSREELMLECMEIAVEVRESQRKARTRERDESAFPRGNSARPERDAESAGRGAGSAGQDAGSAGLDAGSQGGNTRNRTIGGESRDRGIRRKHQNPVPGDGLDVRGVRGGVGGDESGAAKAGAGHAEGDPVRRHGAKAGEAEPVGVAGAGAKAGHGAGPDAMPGRGVQPDAVPLGAPSPSQGSWRRPRSRKPGPPL